MGCARICSRYIGVIISIVAGSSFACYGIYHLNDPGFVNDIYCQKNSMMKTGEDVVEDSMNTTCNSEIVLEYEPDDLKPYLEGMLYLQAIIGPCLVMTGVAALVGFCRTGARLLVPWLVVNLIWVVSLVIAVAMLGAFGFQEYIYVLLGFLVLSVLSLLDVGCYYLWKISRQGSNDFEAVSTHRFGDETGNDGGNVPAWPAYKPSDDVPVQYFRDHDETTGAVVMPAYVSPSSPAI